MALEQNREVFAVPGRIDSHTSEGTHALIRQGAHLVHSVEDILSELSVERRGEAAKPDVAPEHLSEAEERLLSLLSDCPLDIEELLEKSGMPVAALHGLLLELELKGLLRQMPGQQYERL
jgi:DNA processing protein